MKYDVYIESVFFSLFRNWNLEPCLKMGGIVIFGMSTHTNVVSISAMDNERDRIRTHINYDVYTGINEITRNIVKYQPNLILNFKEFENRIGYTFTPYTKHKIKEVTSSEGIWFLNRKIKVEKAPL